MSTQTTEDSKAKTIDDIKAKTTDDSKAKIIDDIKAKSACSTKDAISCYLCRKPIPSANAMSVHKRDQHDGVQRRIFPLKCPWCDIKPMNTRSGLTKHLASRCEGVLRLRFPLSCPFCEAKCQGSVDLSKHSASCYSWEQDTSSDNPIADEFGRELLRVTKLPATARYLEQLFQKAEVRLDNGERELAFIISRGSKRLKSGSKAHVHIVERSALGVFEDTKLDLALESHAYGRLVCLEDYTLLEDKDPLWHLPFPDNGELLATMFQGMLIQSDDEVLLAYKVEVYGTADYEDPHAQELAKPEGEDAFKVENVCHDQTHKVMVGTIKWCVLVTLAVILTDGTVVVGPDNKFFHPKAASHVWIKKASYDWIKKEPAKGLYNTMARQLRSKFYDEATFALYSAVHPPLNHYTTMPVTLRTLYGFKSKSAWSGVKVAAFVFHQLYTKRKIVKAEVQTHTEEALSNRKGKSCESLQIVERMIQVMAEEEAIPVSKSVNKCLTELAGNLSGEITNLNNTDVMDAVVKKIKTLMKEKDDAAP
ncbi:hypothetical protein BGZ74_001198 [Mortierella antarctica]|nr:hypothetical protein BGZ74_001198 [Mortierella antarctica]